MMKKKKIILFEIVFIILFIFSIMKIVLWNNENKENNKIKKQINVILKEDNNDNNESSIDLSALKLQNKDTVAYLKVNNTNISYPVVKSSNNSYYLNHNFEKSYNEAGWIFADYKNKFDGTDKNIVIYGRNRRDLSMFGSLKNILDTNWYNKKENLKIEFITNDVENIYEIFSIYKIENEDYYIKTEFANNEFSEFINTLKNRSIKNFNTNVDENDNIFTLSTCVDNNKYRIVLHAKKMQ